MAISSALKKTTFLLLITTLTISLGTSAEFTSPNEDIFQTEADFYVDTSDIDSVENVTFSAAGPNDGNFGPTTMNQDQDNADNYTLTFGRDDIDSSSGDYEITAEVYSGSSVEETLTETVTFDGSNPNVELLDDSEYLASDPELTFEVSDDHSELIEVTGIETNDDDILDETNEVNCDPGDTCETDFNLDTSSLDSEDDINLEITLTDEVGNEKTSNYDFTYDDEWDGDDSASVEWVESESSVLTGFEDEDQDLDVEFTPDSVSDTTVVCEADGEEVDVDSVDASDEEESAACEFDSDEYASSVFDLTVEAEDAAGNSQTLVDGEELVWDTQRPTISSLSQPDGVSTFNSGFDLSLTATDDASGIQMVEYYFDASTGVGDGNQINLDNSGSTAVETDFSVEPDLGQGEHTVYVRVEDGTGQTDVQSFDFEYFPDREPNVNLNAPESVEVTSGETKTFTLTIENGAPFFINGVEIQSDSAVWNGTVTATSLEEGDSVEKTVTVDASNIDVGTYDLELETVDLSNSMTVEVIVRATEDQKSGIDSELQEWQDLSSELEENVSSIGTVDESNENVSRFLSRVSSVQTAVDEGRYYEAKNHLESIESEYESAQATYSEAKDRHEKKVKTRMFMLAIFGVLIIGGGGTGLLLYSKNSEELPDFVPDDLDVEMPEEVPKLGVIDKVKELIQDAEDEVEEETGYSFDGFD